MPIAYHEQGLDREVLLRLRHHRPDAAPNLDHLAAYRRRRAPSRRRGHDRRGRQVHRADRRLQVAGRGACPWRHRQPGQGQAQLDRFGDLRARGRGHIPGIGPRHPGAGRVRRARLRGQDRRGDLRARAQGALFRHLLRHADGGDRGGAEPGRHRGRRLHRVRALRGAGRRPDDRMDARQHGREARARPSDLGGTMRLGAYDCDLVAGTRVAEIYGAERISERHRHRYEVNINYRKQLEAAGHRLLRPVARRRAAGDRRAGRPSLVRRRAVPSGAEVQALRAAPAVRLVRRRGGRAVAAGLTMAQPRHVRIGRVTFGNDLPLALIAGPCAIESRDHALEISERLVRDRPSRLGVGLIYKTTFDKANRTSSTAPRGIGMDEGLPILAEVRETHGCPVLTDVHEREQCAAVAEAVDVLQIPAFLCRQTDLLVAAAQTGQGGQRQEGAVPGALGHEERRRQGRRVGQRQRAGDRARRQLRLQHPGLRHARPADHGAGTASGGVRRNPFGAAAGRAGRQRAAASGSSCPCWPAPPSPSASPPSSWKPTRIPTTHPRRAQHGCRSTSCRRCSRDARRA